MTQFHDGLSECHYFISLFVSSLSLFLHSNVLIQLNYIVFFQFFFFCISIINIIITIILFIFYIKYLSGENYLNASNQYLII